MLNPCLLTTTEETIERDSWLGNKRATYRVQKATLTVKEKVKKVEEFSNYLITPMRKRYDLVFRSTAVTFKAINCWLNLEVSDKAPRHWKRKRQAINQRIISLSRCPKEGATIEEIDSNDPSESETQYVKTEEDIPKVATLGRLEVNDRLRDIPAVLQYNILRKKDNIDIQRC